MPISSKVKLEFNTHARRTSRRVCLSVLLAFGLILVHAGVLASSVRTFSRPQWPYDADDYRRHISTAADGTRLFGVLSIVQHQSLFRPVYCYTSRSAQNYWFHTSPHRAPARYEELREGGFYFSPRLDLHGREHGTIATIGYGWPFVALASDHLIGGTQPNVVLKGIQYSPEKAVDGSYARAFPTRVVWSGLVANLALYTPLTLALLVLFSRVHRVVIARPRVRRGLCVRCAYPLDGLAICPECGTEQQAPPHD